MREILEPVATELWAAASEVELASLLPDAEVLILRGHVIADEELIELGKRLKVIARAGAGYENVDVAAATARGIPVLIAPGRGARAVAEGTMALILACAKRLHELDVAVHAGDWGIRNRCDVKDLADSTLGIVGYGSIGRAVGRFAMGMGMRVVASDPRYLSGTEEDGARFMDLGQLAATADVVTLHCELNERTRGMIDRSFLARLKPGASLINVARGGVIESDEAILEALTTGGLAAVALDVHSQEPPGVMHRLYSDPRVLCTPHAVGTSRGWYRAVFGGLASDIQAIFRGELTENVVNADELLLSGATGVR